jgi:TorA maturation chaperone TorD
MNIDKRARTEYATLNRNRAGIYKFLSKIYETEVTTEFLKETASEKNPLRQVGELESIEPRFREGSKALRSYLAGLGDRDLENVKLELAAEYASLFLGLAGKPPHPSESAYKSESHNVMGQARDEVLGAYRNAGLDKIGEFKEPEDHIAVELSFMEYLCSRTAESIENDNMKEAVKYLEIQRNFLNKHLAAWVPSLAKDILESAELGFYKGIAKITDEFISMDQDTVAELIVDMGDV